jgi:hypothetical protein
MPGILLVDLEQATALQTAHVVLQMETALGLPQALVAIILLVVCLAAIATKDFKVEDRLSASPTLALQAVR